jgi:hypothetical protein
LAASNATVAVHGSTVTSVQKGIERRKYFSEASVDHTDAPFRNDEAQQQGPLGEKDTPEDRHADPVCCTNWFGLVIYAVALSYRVYP